MKECIGCHLPVRGNDSVYTLPISTAQIPRNEIVNSNAAMLPASLPWQPLGWNPITINVDRSNRTTAILFGNDAALSAVHARATSSNTASSPTYPAGAVLALVTWAQRDDPHWFGARIPDRPLSVEFVEVAAPAAHYRIFSGPELREIQPDASSASQRESFILTLPPARLP